MTAADIFNPIRDVTTGDLPPALVHNILHPTLDTLLYAFGGTGKGVIAAWCAAQDTKNGGTVGILDYESNADEWYRRIERFKGDLDRVRIVLPSFEPHGFLLGQIWGQAEELAAAVKELGITRAIVDSVVPATEVDETQIGSPAIPINFFRATRTLQIPVLSIGHASGQMDRRSLVKPWGSHYWRNIPRITWAAWLDEKAQTLELFVTKRNTYRGQGFTIPWGWANELGDGVTPEDLEFVPTAEAAGTSAADVIEDYLEDRAVDAARDIAPTPEKMTSLNELADWFEEHLPQGKRGTRNQRLVAIHRAAQRDLSRDGITEVPTGETNRNKHRYLYHFR
ncbi:MAG: hypothetical protein ACLP8B_11870, partial [Xanthobacteraceae bacterium]